MIAGNGYGLHWPTLNVDLAIPNLTAELLGTRSWMARQAGRVTAESKATAVGLLRQEERMAAERRVWVRRAVSPCLEIYHCALLTQSLFRL